ncbi:MAG: DbpA RNA binding domain-containing protein, partial [Zetaproteobacteria bacterium]|nr:DbpA RNA binding domain-containing protein [Zetaproteobacteria bacterium]
QIALFSATMPQQVRRIAARHLNDPVQITIKMKTTTAETIRQRFWSVSGVHKLDALTRILEAEHFDAMLVFVRTKTSTVELAEKLEARGYASAALNGDIPQAQRERTIQQLKKGKVDILVATDVAARGLDVARISHVINYDIPYDAEAYVHRIGRTGRAGKKGDAILFVAPREKRLLGTIEKTTRQKIDRMELPSTELVNDKRIAKFKQRITDTLAEDDAGLFTQLIEQYQQEHNVPGIEIAAALARLLQGDAPFLLQHKPQHKADKSRDKGDTPLRKKPARKKGERPAGKRSSPDEGMQTFRIEVGKNHKVMPGNIVGAIANEAGLDSQHIGRINIYDDYSLIDLPDGMPRAVFNDLKKVRVGGKQLNISLAGEERKAGKPTNRAKDRKPGKSANAAKHGKPGKPAGRAKSKGKPRSKSEAKPGKSIKKKARKKRSVVA